MHPSQKLITFGSKQWTRGHHETPYSSVPHKKSDVTPLRRQAPPHIFHFDLSTVRKSSRARGYNGKALSLKTCQQFLLILRPIHKDLAELACTTFKSETMHFLLHPAEHATALNIVVNYYATRM